MYSVRGSMPPLLFSSVEDERKHMLLLHCPLSSEYVQGAELGFSFLVDTEIKEQSTVIAEVIPSTESWLQSYKAYWKVYFPKVLFLTRVHQMCKITNRTWRQLLNYSQRLRYAVRWFCSTAVVLGLHRNSKLNISLIERDEKKVSKQKMEFNYKSFLIKSAYNKMNKTLSILMHKVFL